MAPCWSFRSHGDFIQFFEYGYGYLLFCFAEMMVKVEDEFVAISVNIRSRDVDSYVQTIRIKDVIFAW